MTNKFAKTINIYYNDKKLEKICKIYIYQNQDIAKQNNVIKHYNFCSVDILKNEIDGLEIYDTNLIVSVVIKMR